MRPWLDSQPGGRRRKLVFEASMGVSRRRSLKALRGRSGIRYDEEANNVDLIAGDFRYSSRQRASPNRDPLPGLVEQMQLAIRRAEGDDVACRRRIAAANFGDDLSFAAAADISV